ncbi:MAG: ACP S-malonyltransferase [Planctomycetia bacterium]|nr:ACP S-malonyltransferase [Planctomycetia bacterium]
MPLELKPRLATAMFAFRGYNVTNLGRSAELLAHPAYGATVSKVLAEASAVASEGAHRTIDLASRIRRHEETDLDSFADAIALTLGMEVAQIALLREFFDVRFEHAQMAMGLSIGEIGAAICAGLFSLDSALRLPVALAADCAELGRDVSMGIVFSLGPALDLDAVNQVCVEINCEQRGTIGISTYLSPNTILVLGQGDTVDRFRDIIRARLPKQVHLRRNEHHWPPLHTPILWQRAIPNRAAVLMHALPGGMGRPTPPILSLVTGKLSYNQYNAREIIHRWIDHPQRVWDGVYESLQAGIETVIHVGPEPNLLPSTYKRLSDNIEAQLQGRSASSLGLRFVSGIARRRWLTALLPSRSALLRAPIIQHVILEDWLLEQKP